MIPFLFISGALLALIGLRRKAVETARATQTAVSVGNLSRGKTDVFPTSQDVRSGFGIVQGGPAIRNPAIVSGVPGSTSSAPAGGGGAPPAGGGAGGGGGAGALGGGDRGTL